jgi:deoxyribodipyrimidine photolyase-related protein
MAELQDEATYVRHHKKKIAFLFAAMRHFADDLSGAGWSVDYVELDSADSRASFTGQLAHAVARYQPQRIVVTEATEWRVAQEIEGWQGRFSLPVDVLPDRRFLCSTAEFGWSISTARCAVRQGC